MRKKPRDRGDRPADDAPDRSTTEPDRSSDTDATEPLTRARAEAPSLPDRIGHYRIVRLVGEGGMGIVYEAEQESPRRKVAIKVIRPGLTSAELLRRFEHESQTLGQLQHPGIAQVFEAGTADTPAGKQPFFAMEFVRGVDLARFVAARNPSVRERLELVARVCDAVHHAHQKGVIHRDLKPGNILVDPSGQPKILDFGVARVTDPDLQLSTLETHLGQLIGTVQYMSPEQAAADPEALDTRSDVYALGVILFEVLAARLPYEIPRANLPEAIRVIREDDPTSLSSVDRSFRGDVETIVSKALEKEPSRRYESAAQLAEDIRRHLRDEPIVARPPSRAYQIRKFARRNRDLVSGIVAAFVLLIAGTAISTWQAIRATRAEQAVAQERDRANLEAATAGQVSAFLVSLFEEADPTEARGETITAREVLDRGSDRLDQELTDQPRIHARLAGTMGKVYRGLGLYDESVLMLEKALEINERELGEGLETAASLHEVARVKQLQGEYEESGRLFRRALAVREKELGENHPLVAETLNEIAIVNEARGDFEAAGTLYRRVLSTLEITSGPASREVAAAHHNVGTSFVRQGRYAEAEPYLKRSVEITAETLGDHPDLASGLCGLGDLYYQTGRYEEAATVFERALAVFEHIYDPEHPDVAYAMNLLGNSYVEQGRHLEARPLFQRALTIFEKRLGADHPNVAMVLYNLARTEHSLGNLEEAKSLYSRSLSIVERALGADHPNLTFNLRGLGNIHREQGNYAEAERLYRRAIAVLEPSAGSEHRLLGLVLSDLAETLRRAGRFAEAESLFVRSLTIYEKSVGWRHPEVPPIVERYAELLRASARPDSAGALERRLAAVASSSDEAREPLK